MEGQLMTIAIFKSEIQPLHRLSKYWYTVESKRSPYYKRASVIWSELHHVRRRTYRVRVNEDTGNPRILKEFGEVAGTPTRPAKTNRADRNVLELSSRYGFQGRSLEPAGGGSQDA